MKRIRAFGCSLTAQHHWQFMFNDVIDYNNNNRVHVDDEIDFQSYAVSAGGNDIQLIQYTNEVHNNNIVNDDIIIWQITNPGRRMVDIDVCSSYDYPDSLFKFENGYMDFENVFNSPKRIKGMDLGSAIRKKLSPTSKILETNTGIYQVVWQLNGVKRENNKLLVLFGWDDLFTSAIEKQNVIKFLKDRDIDYLEDSILEWTVENGHTPDDTEHPSLEGYSAYTQNVLVPKLKSLNWL